jgi:hypothetical protein
MSTMPENSLKLAMIGLAIFSVGRVTQNHNEIDRGSTARVLFFWISREDLDPKLLTTPRLPENRNLLRELREELDDALRPLLGRMLWSRPMEGPGRSVAIETPSDRNVSEVRSCLARNIHDGDKPIG